MQVDPKHILLAEDNTAMGTVIRFILARAGYRVTLAKDGREAWQYLQSEKIDMLVTDYQMPEMTGEELCERLRHLPALRRTPVIMITAKGLEVEVQKLRDRLDIIAIFLKPFSPREVIQTVDKYFASSQTATYERVTDATAEAECADAPLETMRGDRN